MVQNVCEATLATRIGQYLKREIRARGMTQEGFAEMLNTSDRTVRRWICEGVHSLDIVWDVANVFGVKVSDILREAEDGDPSYRILIKKGKEPGGHSLSLIGFFFCVIMKAQKERECLL